MMADFRALCAELTGWIERSTRHYIRDPGVLIRARAALADEPAVPQGREPGAADLEKEFRSWWKETHGSPYFGAVPLVAVLSWTEYALARWGNPAPAPPSDGEVAELVVWLLDKAIQAADASQPTAAGRLTWAAQVVSEHAELLQRQALVPVAVSERWLPGPEDCDDQGRCWWLVLDQSWPCLYLMKACIGLDAAAATHWLPAHALPVPEAQP